MSYAIEVEISNSITPAVRRLSRFLGSEAVKELIGRTGANLFRDHLFAYNRSHPNRLGGDRTNYWSQAARSANFKTVSDGAVVSVSGIGLNLHYRGGTVTPGKNHSSKTGRPTKYLTIPAIPEAHGRRASDFTGLRAVFGQRGGALIQKPAGTVKGASKAVKASLGAKTGRVVFWLVKKATIKAKPDIVPSGDALLIAVSRAVVSAANRSRKGVANA